MVVTRTVTCADDDGEFVILPPEVAFGLDVEVDIVRSGDVLTIRRVGSLAHEANEAPAEPPSV